MRHRKERNRLSLPTAKRKALLQSLVKGIFLNDSIKTTFARAKEARRHAERLVTLAKDNSVASRRKAFEFLNDRTLVKNLFDEIAPRFGGRSGGYTRILKIGKRKGDGAQMTILELVVKRPPKPKEKPKEAPPKIEKPKPPKPEAAPRLEKEALPKVEKEKPKGFFGSLRDLFRKKQDRQEV